MGKCVDKRLVKKQTKAGNSLKSQWQVYSVT